MSNATAHKTKIGLPIDIEHLLEKFEVSCVSWGVRRRAFSEQAYGLFDAAGFLGSQSSSALDGRGCGSKFAQGAFDS